MSSTAIFSDVSPIDEEPIAEVARGGAGEVDQAVAAARAATKTWGSMPPKERAETLHRIADGVEARVPELAAVETRDNGSLLRSMRNSVMPRVARNFRFFADQLLALET
ncbi:MAG TPA: aldehyde dehydrogenase family protein, partial [Actinomycetota bacterium]